MDLKVFSHIISNRCNVIHSTNKIVYMAILGSHLHGTNNADSDYDVKGVFIPDKKFLLTGGRINGLNFKLPEMNADVEMWTIQRYKELLSKNEANAIDLLFSYGNPKCVLMKEDDFCNNILRHPEKIINMNKIKNSPFIKYSYNQYCRYFTKGERINELQKILIFLSLYPNNITLGSIREVLTKRTIMEEVQLKNNSPGFKLHGKYFSTSLDVGYLKKWIDTTLNKYGKRTVDSSENENIDYKSLSHAIRGLLQIEELIETGYIKFPLKQCELLKSIKTGKINKNEVQSFYDNKLMEIQEKELRYPNYKFDEKHFNNTILEYYP